MRDYDPTTGRYLQGDPLGLVDGASVYGYALQNPGRYTDPTGEYIPALLFWIGVGVLIDYMSDEDECFSFAELAASIAANLNPLNKLGKADKLAKSIKSGDYPSRPGGLRGAVEDFYSRVDKNTVSKPRPNVRTGKDKNDPDITVTVRSQSRGGKSPGYDGAPTLETHRKNKKGPVEKYRYPK